MGRADFYPSVRPRKTMYDHSVKLYIADGDLNGLALQGALNTFFFNFNEKI